MPHWGLHRGQRGLPHRHRDVRPTFTADVMAETLRRTALGALAPGSPVNLERPLRLGGRLGGHLVQGHVDAVAVIVLAQPGPALGRGADRSPRPAWPGTSWKRARSPWTG